MPLIAQAIIDVATVKQYVKLVGTADDTLIENIINGVSILFEKYCGAKFINQTITEVLDGSGEEKILVEYIPIVSLTEIKSAVDDTSPETLTITDFSFNPSAGIIRYKTGIFEAGFQNISIKYSSGYGAAIANLPDDLKLAALKQCEFFYKRDAADFSDTFDEGMIIRAPSEMLSPTVKDMLTPYFRVRL
jgi:uncharacterized phiE125 gp8 family phage protein